MSLIVLANEAWDSTSTRIYITQPPCNSEGRVRSCATHRHANLSKDSGAIVSKYYPYTTTTNCVFRGLEIEKGRKKGRETRNRIGPRVGSSDEHDRIYAGNVSGAHGEGRKTGRSALFMGMWRGMVSGSEGRLRMGCVRTSF
jgi:hypothetical protein